MLADRTALGDAVQDDDRDHTYHSEGSTTATSDDEVDKDAEAQAQAEHDETICASHRSHRSPKKGAFTTNKSIVSPDKHAEGTQRLNSLLIKAFRLPPDETLIDHYPAWLLKSVMLQGHLYLTLNHVCFYSYIPRKDDVTIKSGFLTKKSRTSSRQHRHWFILKNNVLSYYDNPSNVYQPNGNINLHRAKAAVIDVKNTGDSEVAFKLTTMDRDYFFRADTATAANEWIKVLQKIIFRLKNEGECVKIAIPVAGILDVEESDVLPFATTLKIRIADDADTFALNEYYFSFFHAADAALRAVENQLRSRPGNENMLTSTNLTAQSPRRPHVSDTSKSAPGYSLHPLRHLISNKQINVEDFVKSLRLADDSSTLPNKDVSSDALQSDNGGPPDERFRHTSLEELQEQAAERQNQSSPNKGLSLKKSLTSQIKNVGHVATSAIQAPIQLFNKASDKDDPGASDATANDAFRREFGLSERERLLKACSSFYRRGVPLPGDFYISDLHVSFRSSTPCNKVRILLPLDAVEGVKPATGFNFGFSGLILSIRAHEPFFFEFTHASERDQCIHFIEGALENLKALNARDNPKSDSMDQQDRDARDEHRALEDARNDAGGLHEESGPPLEDLVGVPPLIFDSPSASMVAFRPLKQLRFTCLTIGSRGDVQPYVALCKGLIADGQEAKIATHEEFRDFVEGHGIEFVPIDGNPAELMAICVEHGMFTYSFLREASRKFRGWIDDLLKSSWYACQNTDVLIESPSAMGGIHIAEALGIPYFRAFTMPWSKTRVYPHAFAVPEHNKGGNWNAFTYSAFDTLFWKAISGQVNRWRKSLLKIPATSFSQLAQHKVPFLYNFSPSVVPPAIDWHDWIKVTGYWFLDGSDDKDEKKWEAPKNVIQFIERARSDNKKLVYIGFGSIVVSDPQALTKAVIEAVKQSGVRCILVKGWSARSSKTDDSSSTAETDKDSESTEKPRDSDGMKPDTGEPDSFPDEILSLDSIPHDWLFPQIDAACHHGGAGSLGASLRAGIPTIVKPFFGDQYFFGDRVQSLGVGVCLRKLTVSNLKEALHTCTTDPLTIQKAKAIGEQIRSECGVEYAIQCIYRDLDYARSLIKPPRSSAGTSESSQESWQNIDADDAVTSSDDDDQDIYDRERGSDGKMYSMLKPFKNLRLPNPLGDKSGDYGLSGLKAFKQSANRHIMNFKD